MLQAREAGGTECKTSNSARKELLQALPCLASLGLHTVYSFNILPGMDFQGPFGLFFASR